MRKALALPSLASQEEIDQSRYGIPTSALLKLIKGVVSNGSQR